MLKGMLVTTTAIAGNDLDNIKSKLAEEGITYTAVLTTSTNVLIARSTEGDKYALAKVRGIPCVTPEWVLSGGCSMDRLNEFEIDHSLQGLEVCTTSLSDDERLTVQKICEAHRAKYSLDLSQRCSVLVVPNKLSDIPTNVKVQFARKYQSSVKPYCQFLQQYGEATGSLSTPSLSARINALRDKSAAVVYCFPPSLVTDNIKMLIKRSGARQAQTLTIVTTHVVLLGPTDEFFAPRPGLEFVSLSWLEECAAQGRGCVSTKPYLVPSVLKPVITFTAVPQVDREALRNSLKRAGMHCFVQEDFVLGADSVGSFARRNTTHLVVGDTGALAGSAKVASLAWRRYKLQVAECFFVKVDWLHYSLRMGVWEECSPFMVDIPHFSEFNKMSPAVACAPLGVSVAAIKGASSAEEDVLKPSSKEATSRDSAQSNSLEHLIGELETKTNTPGTTSVSSAMGAGNAQERCTYEHGEGNGYAHGVEVSFDALSTAFGKRCEPETPPASQLIVYRRNDVERPQVMWKEVECTGASLRTDEHSAGDVPPDGYMSRSSRLCCIMVSRSLLHLEEDITQLGALGFTIASSIEECTHYITERPSRTEYFLSAVSAGKWVLAPSFVKEAQCKNHIPLEEPHEWCPEMARRASLRNSVCELVKACRLQRCRIDRPFDSWNVFLCCSTELRTKSFTRVLQSGGCKVVVPRSPQELVDTLARGADAAVNINFVLSDDNHLKHEELVTVGSRLKIYRMEYIAHCLCTNEPDPTLYELVPKPVSRKRPKDVQGG